MTAADPGKTSLNRPKSRWSALDKMAAIIGRPALKKITDTCFLLEVFDGDGGLAACDIAQSSSGSVRADFVSSSGRLK